MRIVNLKAPQERPMDVQAATPTVAEPVTGPQAVAIPVGQQGLEIAFLKARIQHLELVVETARSLMGSNHERLLRRLHEVPRELVELSNQLRRVDSHATW
jgi:hypothetical protein